MTIREELERSELERLSPYAVPSVRTRGRALPDDQCPLRTEFQRDRDRILHSKSFRRLKFKTQVFLAPEGDHYRTRLTHTLEVAQIARTIARCLRLNEDLTEAIALGHDLGHTPFGHIGERTLDTLMPEGFRHNEQSRRVAEVLEKDGRGLNLTWEVLDGILTHSGDQLPATLEGHCVRKADRIAYLNHDMDDAIRAGVLSPEDIPEHFLDVLGHSHSKRINTMIADIVEHSQDSPELVMSPPIQAAMDGLREFMFERVYRSGWRAAEEIRCDHVIWGLFGYYNDHPVQMPEEFRQIAEREGTERGICDFISCMTDRYAIRTYERLYVPSGFQQITRAADDEFRL